MAADRILWHALWKSLGLAALAAIAAYILVWAFTATHEEAGLSAALLWPATLTALVSTAVLAFLYYLFSARD